MCRCLIDELVLQFCTDGIPSLPQGSDRLGQARNLLLWLGSLQPPTLDPLDGGARIICARIWRLSAHAQKITCAHAIDHQRTQFRHHLRTSVHLCTMQFRHHLGLRWTAWGGGQVGGDSSGGEVIGVGSGRVQTNMAHAQLCANACTDEPLTLDGHRVLWSSGINRSLS